VQHANEGRVSSVFISYRRQTASGEARALFKDFVAKLGENSVFMDVDSISLGRDFRNELQRTVAACDVMLVLIDKEWAAAKDERGRVRLENADDFVRMEVEAALKRDIVVIPVLIQGARMPAAEELPAAISNLAYRNAFELSHTRWESDVREMIRRLNLNVAGQVGTDQSKPPRERLAPETPPLPGTPPLAGSSEPPIKRAGWLTRRHLLATTAATMMASAVGGGAYFLMNPKQKEPVPPATNKPPATTSIGEPIAVIQGGPIAAIKAIAAQSTAAAYIWKESGKAPSGYIKGMALVYARVYRKFVAGNASALDMAKANSGDADRDALAYYGDIFAAAGMSNSASGADTLRHLFVLIIGLGMRESRGRYCQGRDLASANTTASTADAGLFGTSYNIKGASPVITDVFISYAMCPSGFEDVFKEGLECSATDFKAVGSGEGEAFQWLSKECPAFAAEVAAVGLRHVRKHWGPINRREVQVVPECDRMLSQVQAFVDKTSTAKLDAALL
jgi:TIR domain